MLRKIASIFAMIIIALNLCGCATVVGVVAGGAGTALWLSGKLTEEVDAPYDKAVTAVKKALDSLDMDIKKITETDKVTQIISEYTGRSKTWIDIRPLSRNRSQIEIRVGIRGDKASSAKIMDKIKHYS
ncbi:MAG: DUF3568 family protein [Candidatus Omnitrophota bacterium]